MYDINNIFYKIIQGQVPCQKIYESDFALSFHDVNPKAKIHALVIPKGQYIDIIDFTSKASAEEIQGFFNALKETADILQISQGFQSLCNTGKEGGQEVFHFHMHLRRN